MFWSLLGIRIPPCKVFLRMIYLSAVESTVNIVLLKVGL